MCDGQKKVISNDLVQGQGEEEPTRNILHTKT